MTNDPKCGAVIEWRIIPCAPDYEVSNYGSVRRLKKGRGSRPGKVVTPYFNNQYLSVSLQVNHRRINKLVHNLVAEAFIGPKPISTDTHHKDEIKINNCHKNLEYIDLSTHKSNHSKCFESIKGEHNGNAKLTDNKVRAIREEYIFKANGAYKLALKYGVSHSVIHDIVNRKAWKHI